MREALIQRLRNLAGMIPHKHTLPSGADTVICSLEAFMQIKDLAGEAADALENDYERMKKLLKEYGGDDGETEDLPFA